jgi:hypothetical protein
MAGGCLGILPLDVRYDVSKSCLTGEPHGVEWERRKGETRLSLLWRRWQNLGAKEPFLADSVLALGFIASQRAERNIMPYTAAILRRSSFGEAISN